MTLGIRPATSSAGWHGHDDAAVRVDDDAQAA
jgi:hypothetical protein